MLNSFPMAVLAGSALGFLAGLGIGGGSLLVLWLTIILGISYSVARGINLLFFIPTAVITCFFRWKQGAISLKNVLPAILCGCATAGAASFFRTGMDLSVLKKIFGALLIFTGIRELFYKPRQEEP